MMDGISEIDRWWELAEEATTARGAGPADHSELRDAFIAIIEGRADASGAHIAASTADGDWRLVRDFIALRAGAVAATHADLLAAADDQAALFAALPNAHPGFRARVLHVRATTALRSGRPSEAEALGCQALDCLPSSSRMRRGWILDTLGSCFYHLGAWLEARLVFDAALSLKAEAGDTIGAGISASTWGRLELDLGNPGEASTIAGRALALPGTLPPLTRLRLLTLTLDANLASGELVAEGEAALRELVKDFDAGHQNVGYAWLSLGRAAHRRGADPAPEFDRAHGLLRLSHAKALLAHWRRRLTPDDTPTLSWLEGLRPTFEETGTIGDGEVQARVLAAGELGGTDRQGANDLLDDLAQRIRGTNNELWFRRLDEMGAKVDPEAGAARVFERFTGSDRVNMLRSERVPATLVFADLVEFTKRSTSLPPEEVMATVRSLYQLAAPLLHELEVRPLTYLGDGLLAAAIGEDHERRGLEFALAYTERMRRVTAIRESVAQRPLAPEEAMTIRCGVASGLVVMGPIGNLLKTEFTSIGLATNRAARLQGYAEPDEVVCDAALEVRLGRLGVDLRERLTVRPKGFSADVHALRLRPEKSF